MLGGLVSASPAVATGTPGRWVVAEAQWLYHDQSDRLRTIYVHVSEYTAVGGTPQVRLDAWRGKCARRGDAVQCDAVDLPKAVIRKFGHDASITTALLRAKVAGKRLDLRWVVTNPLLVSTVSFDRELCTANGGQQNGDVTLNRSATATGMAFGRTLRAKRARSAILGVGVGTQPC
jgi:hypothetical protein